MDVKSEILKRTYGGFYTFEASSTSFAKFCKHMKCSGRDGSAGSTRQKLYGCQSIDEDSTPQARMPHSDGEAKSGGGPFTSLSNITGYYASIATMQKNQQRCLQSMRRLTTSLTVPYATKGC